MKSTIDHKPGGPDRPEYFLAWVCSSLSCPEWGPASDTPRTCIHGHPVRDGCITLIAKADAEQMVAERLARA